MDRGLIITMMWLRRFEQNVHHGQIYSAKSINKNSLFPRVRWINVVNDNVKSLGITNKKHVTQDKHNRFDRSCP